MKICNHPTCNDSCRRPVKEKKIYTLKRTPLKKTFKPKPVNDELQQWFLDRRKEMIGYCACGCGSDTSKYDDKLFKHSICHILEKRNFTSLKTHPLNFIELAFWGGCHSNMDNLGASEWPKKKYWPEVVRRFKLMYPEIDPSEYQFIPKVLLETL